MTAAKVVDASALAALIFGEPEAEAVAARLEGSRLLAPGLIAFELANVCLKKCRRHPEQQEALLAGFQLGLRLGVEEIAIDHAGVLALAMESDLTTYDASYLWAARAIGAELVTLERVRRKCARFRRSNAL